MDDLTIFKSQLEEIKEKSKKYLIGNYNRFDVAFKYGVGDALFDTENREYIDFQSGISVTNLGHSEADIIEALRDQADRLFHTSNLYYSEEQALLAEALVVNSFPSKAFFCNSGTEANEAAFKLARKHAINKGISSPIILALDKSFHGRTVGSMCITGQEKIRGGFGELLSGVDFVTTNNVQNLHHLFHKYAGRVAAIFLEPILGESGVIPLSMDFLVTARRLSKEANALFILDEIQTGMGRTGKLFCYQHYNLEPDAMTLAKALGSGFPIGAILVGLEYADLLEPGTHGSTFGGNHLAARIALETIRILLSREILTNIEALSSYFFMRLNLLKSSSPKVKEVRGKGLHIGLELNIPSRPIAEECLKSGLVINATADTVIRIMPPLNMSLERADAGLSILEKVLLKS